MAAMKTVPQLSLSHNSVPRHGVLTLFGYGIKVCVDRGHLLIEDGIGAERFRYRLPRIGHGLRRLVMIGNDGFVTLGAFRWLSDQGAAFVMLDRRGKVLAVTGPVASSDAKLRRAQALALGNGTALKISKELISQKLAGQELLVRDMLHDAAAADAIAQFREDLPKVESIDAIRLIEAQAARCYWQSWSRVAICWPRIDERRVPEHWKRFGSRISLLTHSPRLAANPPNALLNLLYALLESEARLSAAAMGLDPGIGVLHVDTPNRDSLACDLMEVCRPKVDAFVLNWLQNEPLRKADFWEDRNGNCRLISTLAIKLAQTSNTWHKLVAPVAEYVAQTLSSSVSRPPSNIGTKRIATRLTQRNKREVKGSDIPPVKAPKPERVCRGCGKELQGDSVHCKECDLQIATRRLVEVARAGRIDGHTSEAIAKEAATHRRHAQARAAWNPAMQPEWLTEVVFSEKVQPALAHVSATTIAKQIGVSRWYAGRIDEFVLCAETQQTLLAEEAERCDVTNKLVVPGLLLRCEVTGKKALPCHLEKSAATGKVALKQFFVSSSISGARLPLFRRLRHQRERFSLKLLQLSRFQNPVGVLYTWWAVPLDQSTTATQPKPAIVLNSSWSNTSDLPVSAGGHTGTSYRGAAV